MLAFIIQRLFQSVLVMLTVALIAFALFNYVGDPINNMVGQDTTQADRERLRQDLGLNAPFVVQFARFVGHAVQGNFGLSYQQARPVGQIILEKMPATLELSFMAAFLALLLGGSILGCIAARGDRRRCWRSRWSASRCRPS